MVRLFVDLDGVLADFELGCLHITGRRPEQFCDVSEMWNRLKPPKCRNFYSSLPLMSGAKELWQSVTYLKPTILTGLPRGNWAEPQKRTWVRNHFGRDVKVICCMAHEKYKYAKRGDVLIDDNIKAKEPWEGAGGVFVHYIATPSAIEALQHLFPPKPIQATPTLTEVDVQPRRSLTICRNFKDVGWCSFGDRCRFSHAVTQLAISVAVSTTISSSTAASEQSDSSTASSCVFTECIASSSSISLTKEIISLTSESVSEEDSVVFARPQKSMKFHVIDLTDSTSS